MATEIERKFLVKNESYKQLAEKSVHIVQGYLSVDPHSTVRLRIVDGESAVITVKSRAAEGHFAHGEWEYEIPVADALEMIGLCGERVIDKTRYIVRATDAKVWEVDEFAGRHAGLVVAEIELGGEDEMFAMPGFVGDEVTGDKRYYNSSLSSVG